MINANHLVLEAGDRDSEYFQEDLDPVVLELAPPLLQDRLVHVLEDPQEADQDVLGGLLLEDDRTFGLERKRKYNFNVVVVGLRLNNAWASGTVLRPFLQPESPLSSRSFGLRLQVQASGFELTTTILEAGRSNH